MVDIMALIETFKPLLLGIGIPTFRCITGWAVKSLEDNEITKFEWNKLEATLIRLWTIMLTLLFGLGQVGVTWDVTSAGFTAVFIDMVLNSLQKSEIVEK